MSTCSNIEQAELDQAGRAQLALLMALVDTLNLLELGEVEKAKSNLRQLTGQDNIGGDNRE